MKGDEDKRKGFVTGDDGKEPKDKFNDKFEQERVARLQRIAERKAEAEKNKPKPKTPKEIKKENEEKFKEDVKDLEENPPRIYDNDEIKQSILADKDELRICYDLAKNQPTMISMIKESLKLKEAKPNQAKDRITYILKKFREMGIVDELMYFNTWIKVYDNKNSKENLKKKFEFTKIEKAMIKKMEWAETMNERARNKNVAVAGFWCLTSLGEEIFREVKKELTGK